MTYQAICTDIDGTLLNSDRDLSPRLKAIVSRFPSQFPIILASSRMPDAMRHLLKDLDRQNQPLIAYNGGFVLGPDSLVLESTVIPLPVVKAISELIQKTEIHLSLFHGENWYESKEDYWSKREILNTKVNPVWMPFCDTIALWKNQDLGAHKVMVMGDSYEISWLFGELHERFGQELHLYRSKDTYIEIAPKKISKATGLKLILEKYYSFGMDQVVAFGDNYNDIDLLQQVGIGVAVGNARPEVKAVANFITLHHKEDGVADFLEKNFLL